MENNEELVKFYNDLTQEVIAKTDAEGGFREDVLTRIYVDHLTEAAEVEDGNLCFHEATGVKINAFSISEDENSFQTSLVLFVTIYKQTNTVSSVPPSEVREALKKLKNFYLKSCNGYSSEIEEAYPSFDIALTIAQEKSKFTSVKLICLTNGTVRDIELPVEEDNGITFVSSVWDLERIYRVCTSGKAREKIVIDLIKLTGKPLTALRIDIPKIERTAKDGTETESGNYSTYLTSIPGRSLYLIYQKYNARLLERNVRAFLQAKGGVNKGIRSTLSETPEMFLAYNNGISATAEEVIGTKNGDGCFTITELHDFQIVNGGQTTASVYNAFLKSHQSLENIYVQAKITVVENKEMMDEVVPQISRCANTQNKVQNADFSANDPFHLAMENLSRTVWAPAANAGQRQTRWFYERARGQFADTRSQFHNPRVFDSTYPKTQYFDKIELARFENLWEQLPYITSKGGQASFRDFMIRLKKRGNFIPQKDYFQDLIAKAILYRTIRRIVREQKDVLGFWVNISDYTFALLSYKTSQRLNLDTIWKKQAVPDALKEEIKTISKLVHGYIVNTSQGKNTTQWCKQKACWNELTENVNYAFPKELSYLLVPLKSSQSAAAEGSKEDLELITAIRTVDAETWFSVYSWGKQTKTLPAFQNTTASNLGNCKMKDKIPNIKQARQGIIILKTAVEKGFIQNPAVAELVSEFARPEPPEP
jgi:hypothetical protein